MNLSGIGMMLKAIGIDPAELEAIIKSYNSQIEQVGIAFNRIETKLDRVMVLMGDSKEEVKHAGNDGDNDTNCRVN